MDTARTSVRLLMAELARAQRAIAHRDTETAQQAIAAALELDPHNVQALEWQADLREGRVSAPLRPHLAPVAAGPARPVAGSWSAFEQRVRQRRASRCLESARAALVIGDHEQAREAIDELAVLYPDHPELAALRQQFPDVAAAPAELPLTAPAFSPPQAWPGGSADSPQLAEDVMSAAPEAPLRVEPAIAPFLETPARLPTRRRAPVAALALAAAAALIVAALATFTWREPVSRTARLQNPPAEPPPAAIPSPSVSAVPEVPLTDAPPLQSGTDSSQVATDSSQAAPSVDVPSVQDSSSQPVTTTGRQPQLDRAPEGTPASPPASAEPLARFAARSETTEPPRREAPVPAPPPPSATTPTPAPVPAAVVERPQMPASESASTGLAETIGSPAASPTAPPAANVSGSVTSARPTPAPPVEPDSPADAADNAVRQVLQRYVQAYNRLDASAARAVWPGVDQGALERAFGQLRAQTLSFDRCTVSVDEEAGSATCTGQARWVPRVGDQDGKREQRTWRFDLTRNGDDWIITRAEARR